MSHCKYKWCYMVACLQILVVCFVRKALDYLFSQDELYWLDHILPEMSLKKKHDKGDITEDAKPLVILLNDL